MVDNIEKANIIFFAGGFSAADEPDGSAKIIVNIFSMKSACSYWSLYRCGGLIIGICNGFQALLNLGLLPYGNLEDASSTSPTLLYNDAHPYVAKMDETRIANTSSPWLAGVQVGETSKLSRSHGEGEIYRDS